MCAFLEHLCSSCCSVPIPTHATYQHTLPTNTHYLPTHTTYQHTLPTNTHYLPTHATYQHMLPTNTHYLPTHATYQHTLPTNTHYLPTHTTYQHTLHNIYICMCTSLVVRLGSLCGPYFQDSPAEAKQLMVRLTRGASRQ